VEIQKGRANGATLFSAQDARHTFQAAEVREPVVLTYEDKKASLSLAWIQGELKLKAVLLDPASAATSVTAALEGCNTCKTAAGGVLSLSDRPIEIRAEVQAAGSNSKRRINLPGARSIFLPSIRPEAREKR
jgi:hypothetical protein